MNPLALFRRAEPPIEATDIKLPSGYVPGWVETELGDAFKKGERQEAERRDLMTERVVAKELCKSKHPSAGPDCLCAGGSRHCLAARDYGIASVRIVRKLREEGRLK